MVSRPEDCSPSQGMDHGITPALLTIPRAPPTPGPGGALEEPVFGAATGFAPGKDGGGGGAEVPVVPLPSPSPRDAPVDASCCDASSTPRPRIICQASSECSIAPGSLVADADPPPRGSPLSPSASEQPPGSPSSEDRLVLLRNIARTEDLMLEDTNISEGKNTLRPWSK